MAKRRPLKVNGVSGLIEMSAADITAIRNQMKFLYSKNPSVTLSVVGSGGNLGNINDTRLQAGAVTTDVSAFKSAAATPDVSTVTTLYGRINQSLNDSGDPTGGDYPVYWDSATSGITEMTAQDFVDTFIDSAIHDLVASNAGTGNAGTYFISTTPTITGATQVSGTPVYVDTRANAGAYTAGGITETQDQPITITSYYLQKQSTSIGDQNPGVAVQCPVKLDGSNGVIVFDRVSFNTLLSKHIRWYTSQATNFRITYNINGSGNNRGTMTDTILNGSNYQQSTVYNSGDDYRTQEFPSGSPITAASYTLKINQS